MKKLLLTLSLLATVCLTACDDDDCGSLYDTLAGRVWAGDLGFYQDGRFPLVSFVYFGPDGFGTDELHYADNGDYLDRLNIRWDTFDDALYIDYGQVDYPRTLRNVRVYRYTLTGDLYIADEFFDRVTLEMQ